MLRRPRKKSTAPDSPEHGRKWWLGTLLAIALTAAGVLFAAHHVRRSVLQFPGFNLAIRRVELRAPGRGWLPREAREEIESIPRTLGTFNLLTEEVLYEVAGELAANTWVREVCSVEKVFPDRIRFTLTVRRPAAWVSLGSRRYLTDAEGVRLPVEKRSSTAWHLPKIVGLPHDGKISVPPPGGVWSSARLTQGICVAAYLLLEPRTPAGEARKIRSIDVSGAGEGGRGVVLTTEDDRRIEWGRTELSGKVRLVSDKRKLDTLYKILRGESSLGEHSYYLLWTQPPTAGTRRHAAGETR